MSNNTNQTQTPQFESLADLGRRLAPQLLDEWNKEPPPTRRELRDKSVRLIENPHLIGGGSYARDIYFALKYVVAKVRTPSRGYTGRDVAHLVDHFHREGMTITQARKHVAKTAKMEFDAVRQNHRRYREAKRDKSR